MSFQGKYQILSAIGKGEAQSFRALQIDSKRPVLVHHLIAGKGSTAQPDLASLVFNFLQTASTEERRNLLDMGEDEGRMYVVTPDQPECVDLLNWLQAMIRARADSGRAADASADASSEFGNIDFTPSFTSEALQRLTNILSPAQAKPAPPAPAKPLTPASAPKPAAPVVASPPEIKKPVEEPAPAAPAVAPPAEVRRIQSPPSPAPPPAIAPSEPVSGGGHEFTSFWEKYNPDLVAGRAAADAALSAKQETPTPAVSAPAAPDSSKVTADALAQLSKELGAISPPSSPAADAAGEPPGQQAEKARGQIPSGFEVVFQSTKPRVRPTGTVLPNQSGIMKAPPELVQQTPPAAAGSAGPPKRPAQPVPPATAKGASSSTPTTSVPEPQRTRAIGSMTPSAPQVVQKTEEIQQPTPSSPSPSATQQMAAYVEPPVEPVQKPAPPPVAAQQSASAGKSDMAGTQIFAVPPWSPPAAEQTPAADASETPGRERRGHFDRRAVENASPKDTGPLSALAAAGRSPGRRWSDRTNPSGPAPEPKSKLKVSVYIANSEVAPPKGGRRKKVWVPIVILSGLFTMAMGLVLFFALKH